MSKKSIIKKLKGKSIIKYKKALVYVFLSDSYTFYKQIKRHSV